MTEILHCHELMLLFVPTDVNEYPDKSQNHTFTSGFNMHAHTHISLSAVLSYLLPISSHPLLSFFPSSPPTLLFSLTSSSRCFYIFVLLSASFPPLSLLCFVFIHVKQTCCNNGMFYSCAVCFSLSLSVPVCVCVAQDAYTHTWSSVWKCTLSSLSNEIKAV